MTRWCTNPEGTGLLPFLPKAFTPSALTLATFPPNLFVASSLSAFPSSTFHIIHLTA
jgi:hypothetical protein